MARKQAKGGKGKKTADNTLRIIGGEWRSRKLQFPTADGLRPTSGMIRETLFNWLQHKVIGASILDMFSGSGALGFEALSRGAASVTMVEKDRKVAEQLKANAQLLQTAKAQVINSDALSWAARCGDSFDIIFLDPPFAADIAPDCLEVCKSGLVKCEGLVYLEISRSQKLEIPQEFEILKSKTSGSVIYQLLQRKK